MTRIGSAGVAVTIAILAVALASAWFSPYITYLVTLAAVFAVMTVAFDVLLGFTGYISLAHGALFGVGAYSLAYLTVQMQWPFWAALLAGGTLAAAAGIVIAGIAFRTRGLYFSVLTLGIGLVGQQAFFLATPITGGVAGFAGILPPQAPFGLPLSDARYILIVSLAALLVTFLCARLFVTSRLGAAAIAVREDLVLAKALGIRVGLARLTAFTFSAFFAGVSGGLYAALFSFIGPETFGVLTAGFHNVVQIVVGGMGTLWGPILGTALLVALPEVTRGAAAYSLLFYGVLLLIVVRFAPYGIAGLATALFDRVRAGRRSKVREALT